MQPVCQFDFASRLFEFCIARAFLSGIQCEAQANLPQQHLQKCDPHSDETCVHTPRVFIFCAGEHAEDALKLAHIDAALGMPDKFCRSSVWDTDLAEALDWLAARSAEEVSRFHSACL